MSGVRAISAGNTHALALLANGTVVAWGQEGDQTAVPNGLDDVVAVSASNGFSVALRSDGSVVAWGLNDVGQIDIPSGLPPVAKIATGTAHTLALLADGTVTTWGRGGYWLDEIPAGLNRVVAIGAGDYASVVLTERAAQSIAFDPVLPVAVGRAASVHAVATSGLPVTYASTTPAVCAVDVATGQLSLDQAGACELTADQAGDLDWKPAPTATLTVVVTAPGTVVAWGYNLVGQTDVPAGLTDVVASEGQSTPPSTVAGAVAGAAGSGHSLALLPDGTVVGWGANGEGQSTTPSTVAGAVAIAAGAGHSLALVGGN